MKKLVVLLIVLSLAASVHAGLDISFSSNNGSYWSYTASSDPTYDGKFSFNEFVGVDTVQEATDKSLDNARIDIPDIYVSGLEGISGTEFYMGKITSLSSTIEIRNGNGGNILTGTLGDGLIVIAGTTASLYPVFSNEGSITNIEWTKGTGPAFMDFSLTLQGGNIDIASMILSGNQDNGVGGSFSGSITQVPEPATLFVLAMGSVLLLKKE